MFMFFMLLVFCFLSGMIGGPKKCTWITLHMGCFTCSVWPCDSTQHLCVTPPDTSV